MEEVKKIRNDVCMSCDEAHESINGRFCRKYGRYVNYVGIAECDKC